ncbi:TPA: hypothetical protein O4H68_004752 [Vibrio alginolyticus]|nr:hypothetical protein [Vibrio alginolyticus]HCZ9551206.1 hypothetical protein [Vibrio alginolyticus]
MDTVTLIKNVGSDLPSKFFCRQINSIQKQFNPNKNADFEKAKRVIMCLFALGETKLALEFGQKFVFDMNESLKGYQLGNKMQGLAILAYLYKNNNMLEEANETLVKYISLNKFFSSGDNLWFIERAASHMEHYYYNKELYSQVEFKPTKNDFMLGYCSELWVTVEYYSAIEFFDKYANEELLKLLSEVIESEKSSLKEMLTI